MADMVDVKVLRTKLGLTQQAFATLIGVSFVSVNQWEGDKAQPSGLSIVLLELLERALQTHAVDAVLAALRPIGPNPTALVEALVALAGEPTGGAKGAA